MKLKRTELLILFTESVNNAKILFDSAWLILKSDKDKHPSLGLAELALEELGKAYSCLSYYSKANEIDDWKTFWSEWKDHELKAHRAFFFEFFSVLRMEVDDPAFKKNFPKPRGLFKTEKEHSFYVDINKGNRKLHIPSKEITEKECFFRLITLTGLFNSSLYVQDWMNSNEVEPFKNAISDYAFKTITESFYQQDVNSVLKSMEGKDENYNRGLNAIKELFNMHLEND